MRWRTLRWWLFGVLAYLGFLMLMFPADFLVNRLQGQLPSLQIVGVSGSVFSGRAEDVRLQGSELGALSWRFDWLALFTFSYGYRLELQVGGQTLSGRVDTRFGHVYLHDLKGRLPVAALEHWSPLPAHSLDGMLGIDLQQVELKAGALQAAEGNLTLDGGVLNWPSSFTLGSFRVDLTPAPGGGVDAQVADVASPLKLRADLSYSAAGDYHLKGVLAAKDPADNAARTLLAGLGQPDSTGQYPFDFKGHW